MKKEEHWKAQLGDVHIRSCVEYMTSGVSAAEIVSMNLRLRSTDKGQVDIFSDPGEDD